MSCVTFWYWPRNVWSLCLSTIQSSHSRMCRLLLCIKQHLARRRFHAWRKRVFRQFIPRVITVSRFFIVISFTSTRWYSVSLLLLCLICWVIWWLWLLASALFNSMIWWYNDDKMTRILIRKLKSILSNNDNDYDNDSITGISHPKVFSTHFCIAVLTWGWCTTTGGSTGDCYLIGIRMYMKVTLGELLMIWSALLSLVINISTANDSDAERRCWLNALALPIVDEV